MDIKVVDKISKAYYSQGGGGERTTRGKFEPSYRFICTQNKMRVFACYLQVFLQHSVTVLLLYRKINEK